MGIGRATCFGAVQLPKDKNIPKYNIERERIDKKRRWVNILSSAD